MTLRARRRCAEFLGAGSTARISLSATQSVREFTGNLRAVQLLLGHSKIEYTVRYLGTEVDDAIEIAEKTNI
jgi:site-specific recombinase XerC